MEQKKQYEKCQECGVQDETVEKRMCGYVKEIYGEEREETVCDACEYQHCMDI